MKYLYESATYPVRHEISFISCVDHAKKPVIKVKMSRQKLSVL